jgi:hypothetical protein
VARNPIPPFILVVAIAGAVAAFMFFKSTEAHRYAATRRVLYQKSEIKLGMTVRYDRGPLAEEDYAMNDIDGVSSSSYRGIARSGTRITIAERPRATLEDGPNVAYFFGEVVQDGIWELPTRPPRGDAGTHFRIVIYQLTDSQHGTHAFEFTDPHYWATTGGHQFHLKLARDKPLPNVLQLTSNVSVEPRYEKLVRDFRSFGPESFRTKVGDAQARLTAHS